MTGELALLQVKLLDRIFAAHIEYIPIELILEVVQKSTLSESVSHSISSFLGPSVLSGTSL